MQNIFKNINKPIRFLPIGNNCGLQHCFNGHTLLGLGNIPELTTPTYGEMRNRFCTDGSEWLYPEMKSFMETKLYETNKEYSKLEKIKVNLEIKFRRTIQYLIRFAAKIKRNLLK